MPGKPQMEVFSGVGDRVAALLRRHPTIGTAVALGREAGLSRQTLHRVINEDTATLETIRAIATALKVSMEDLVTGAPALPDTRPAANAEDAAGPRHLRNLPLEVRVYLDELRLRLTKGGATEDEVDRAMALLRRPSIFSWYSVGTPKDLSPAKVLQTMKAITESAILPYLREQGRKV
jgi:lambda repressor-like predicted transcriptional regulator